MKLLLVWFAQNTILNLQIFQAAIVWIKQKKSVFVYELIILTKLWYAAQQITSRKWWSISVNHIYHYHALKGMKDSPADEPENQSTRYVSLIGGQ